MPQRVVKRDAKMLSRKEAKFVAEYAVNDSPNQAAIAAGYQGIGSLLKRPHVVKAIKQTLGKIMSKKKVTAERVIEEMAKIAFANIDDHIDDEYRIYAQKASRRKMAAVQSVTTDTRIETNSEGKKIAEIEKVSLKMYDKQKALDSLARHFGLFNDKLELTGDLAERLTRANDRVGDNDATD